MLPIRYPLLAVLVSCAGLAHPLPLVQGQEAPAVATEGAVKADAAPGAVSAPVAIGPDGKPIVRPPRPGQPGSPPIPGQPGGPPGVPGAPGAAKPDEKKDQAPGPINRPDKPPLPPDPRELGVKPNPDGKLKLNFHGQRWADVLEWLARVSGMSLDWQELPGDYLNLITQREYSVAEARDLINSHLIARGYTMLQHGEVLSIVSIQKLIPGMVPRVEANELSKHMPHEYVKVSFPLEWLLSEKAVEELKPMLSPNAKITALKATNRIEAMDIVVNLREVYALLTREQSHEDEQRLVKEFPLKHTRASEVLEQLRTLLGIESKPAAARPMSPEEMMQQQQQQQMMQQMQRQQGGQPAPQAKKDEDVRLLANSRKNSILATAPADKMAIVSEAIKAIDVESDRTQSLLTNVNRMQVYRLHSIDPDALVRTLREVGEMEPATRLEVDTKNKAVIAYASLADHMTIRQVVERLDGSTRKFEVVHLRRLEADYVAGTIDFMMSGPKEEKQQPRYYDYYYSPSRSSSQSQQSDDKFRVDADVENNRLLMWANEIELQEVTNLLIKLGEIPSQTGRSERVRVLDAVAPEEVEQLVEKLRRAWPSLAPNQLNLPEPKPKTEPEAKKSPVVEPLRQIKEARSNSSKTNETESLLAMLQLPAKDTEQVEKSAPIDEANRPSDSPAIEIPRKSDSSVEAPAQPSQRQVASASPPIDITVTPDGRLMISSQDTQALDILEELIGQVAPPRRDYRIFKLKYADSYWVSRYLEDFFDDSGEKKKDNSSNRVYYYDYAPPKKEDPQYRLSKRRKLKFIDDPDTNSILVQGGDSEQLKTIEDLISIYDQPHQADANAARLTTAFQIRYSKAQTIAEAVKDVYRDLLSDNDKALQNNNPEQKNRPVPGGSTYIFNEGGDTNSEKERTRVSFKGKLSVGVDELTNTLLVSTEGEILMRNVTEMVKQLDEAAKPLSSVSIVKLNGSTNSAKVREVLSRLLTEPKPAAKKPTGPQQPQQQPQQNEQVEQGIDIPPGYAPR